MENRAFGAPAWREATPLRMLKSNKTRSRKEEAGSLLPVPIAESGVL